MTDERKNGTHRGHAGFDGAKSSVQVSTVREEIESGVVLTIGTGVLSQEEREEIERRRLAAQKQQQDQVVPAGGSGPQVLQVQSFSGKKPQQPRKASRKAQQEALEKDEAHRGPRSLNKAPSWPPRRRLSSSRRSTPPRL